MEVIPAVDLMGGRVVRLTRGRPEEVRTYEHLGDPVTVAERWESEGAGIIHVVDLDATLGLGDNRQLIGEIASSVGVPLQVGGGIRNLKTAKKLLDGGVWRVIAGSLAFRDRTAIGRLLDDYGASRVAVALDHLDGEVMVRGWHSRVGVRIEEALSTFMDMGVEYFLITSIARDGTLQGPDIKSLERICKAFNVKVMAAGGVRSLEDLILLRDVGVYGVVVGKALYEGKFTLKDAIETIRKMGGV